MKGALSLHLSRHDQHNLEFKQSLSFSSDPFRAQIDIFLFIPKSLHITQWDKAELQGDFHSRLRLALQQDVAQQELQVRSVLRRLKAAVHSYDTLSAAELSEALEEMLDLVRNFGGLMSELLRCESKRLRREISNLNSKSATHCISTIEQIEALVHEARYLFVSKAGREVPVLRLLQQYLHSFYSDFLYGLIAELDQTPVSDIGKPLRARLEHLQTEEAQHYKGDPTGPTLSDADRELHLLKMSQIKKFFQAQMFVDVTSRAVLKKYAEPAAIGAAAAAALAAGLFQHFSHSGATVGIGGAMVIGIGAGFYVLRDRLKDRFRDQFTRKLSHVLPDSEQTLTANKKVLGKITQRFSLRGKKDLPKEVFEARRRGDLTSVERHLPEDVIHHSQIFDLFAKSSPTSRMQGSLQQVIRINVDRYLKFLDDPYKSMHWVGPKGDFTELQTHRIYHFYACIMTRGLPAPKRFGTSDALPPADAQLYRIVLDKNGIDRVEALDGRDQDLLL